MATTRIITAFTRISLLAAVAVPALGTSAPAWAQANCNPPCATGQLCVQGMCMVPAPAAPANTPPPAYYPPAGTPPPVYYPPAAGSPQPGYYAPPPGSPPPGYAAPPAGYAPPPGYGQPGAYPPPDGNYAPPPPPPPPSTHHGFLALPYLGFNTYQGDAGRDRGPGFRLGTLLGGRVNEMFSINGELTIDFINVDNVESGTDVSAADVTIGLSPLFHVLAGNIEFVVGPRLGVRARNATFMTALGDEVYTATGFVLGLNAGLFAAVGNSMSIGGILSLDSRTLDKVCQTLPGTTEDCVSGNEVTLPSDKVLGLAAALLF